MLKKIEEHGSFPNISNHGYFLSDIKVFEKYIHPFLKPFSALLGADYEDPVIPVEIETGRECELRHCRSYTLSWKLNGTYAIPPKKVSLDAFPQSLIAMQKKGQGCDLTLQTKDKDIPIHSIVLISSGGEVFKQMLDQQMAEAKNKKISLTDFSTETIQAFVDFLYQGELDIEEYESNKEVVWELFRFAHTYQIDRLLDCCTNLISLFSTEEDLGQIRDYVDLYENEHLRLLAEHFEKACGKS